MQKKEENAALEYCFHREPIEWPTNGGREMVEANRRVVRSGNGGGKLACGVSPKMHLEEGGSAPNSSVP